MVQLEEVIRKRAAIDGLNPDLIACVIAQESGGNPWAYRFEPGFYRRYISPLTPTTANGYIPRWISWDSEKMARSTSYGLMQVMGETARSIARYTKESLVEMCDPVIGVDVGCTVFSFYLKREKGDINRALASYNAGSPAFAAGQAYAKKVQTRLAKGDHEKIYRLSFGA